MSVLLLVFLCVYLAGFVLAFVLFLAALDYYAADTAEGWHILLAALLWPLLALSVLGVAVYHVYITRPRGPHE